MNESFVGRKRELAVRTGALDDALSGHGRIISASGEAGIGKTRLAEQLSELAVSRDAETLWGRYHEEGGAPSYWPWIRALRSHILTVDEGTLLKEAGNDAALLVLDDLQWADGSNLDLLEFVASEIQTIPFLIVCAYRDTDMQPGHGLPRTLASLRRERTLRGISLAGLGRAEISDLITVETGDEPAPDLIGAVHDHTDRNPFFIGEVIHILREREFGDSTNAVGESDWHWGFPVGIAHLLGRRLKAVPDSCQTARESHPRHKDPEGAMNE
jgi:predicted ATPase